MASARPDADAVIISPVPCKDCPDRRLRCHSVCEKYLVWERIHADALQKRDADREYAQYRAALFYRIRMRAPKYRTKREES